MWSSRTTARQASQAAAAAAVAAAAAPALLPFCSLHNTCLMSACFWVCCAIYPMLHFVAEASACDASPAALRLPSRRPLTACPLCLWQDIPTAYRERMKRVQEQQAARQQQHKGFLGGVAKR